jgi:phosphatidylserine/phosphatidylglycerophosphate/cardiolipin synthase-like enzyme
MSLTPNAARIVDQWLLDFKHHTSTNLTDDPNYYLTKPEALVTTSKPQKLLIGTGKEIVRDILTAFQTAQHEIVFVTCFWAKSDSRAALSEALRTLSSRCLSEGRRIRVRICLSSLSLWQKLTQTKSLSGKEYAPPSWEVVFGLPKRSELQGLDTKIRSIFVLPFSVMHPKFVIVDRETMFLPSCNVSWENWLEGCIELRGDIVEQTLIFWMKFWARDEMESLPPLGVARGNSVTDPPLDGSDLEVALQPRGDPLEAPLSSLGTIPTVLLPSPHHRNPSFRPMPWSSSAPPPPSPLNTFLTTIFNAASRSIYIQSPNVNSPPLLSAVGGALRRGVNVKVVSNTKMMIVEQLTTAGTMTECALRKLHRNWKREVARNHLQDSVEAALLRVGNLEMFYFEQAQPDSTSGGVDAPVRTHLKLTVVEEIVVLGSGNMDRASWYTSQELDVAFFSRRLAREVLDSVGASLEGRLRNVVPDS